MDDAEAYLINKRKYKRWKLEKKRQRDALPIHIFYIHRPIIIIDESPLVSESIGPHTVT